MGDRTALRLFSFRPLGSGADFDARMRGSLLPSLIGAPGLRDVYVGRRGPDESGERVIASIWQPAAAMDTAAAGAGEGRLAIESSEDLGDVRIEVLDLAVDLVFDRPEPPAVLRVFRGQVRPGELDVYVSEARSGTLSDAIGIHGPLGLYLGAQPPDRFVTVSVWTDWASIEAATHGNIRKPIATSNAARLVGGTATHYEIVPSAAHRRIGDRQATDPE